MQRGPDNGWITDIPTPGTVNTIPPTTEPETDPNPSTGIPPDNNNGDPAPDLTPVTVPPTTILANNTIIEPKQKKPLTYSGRALIPDNGVIGANIIFRTSLKEDTYETFAGKFEWTFGDGSVVIKDRGRPINHVFRYPGKYTVTFNYYSNWIKEDPDITTKKIITIIPESISISGTTDDNGVTLSNASTQEIDLLGWKLQTNNFMFAFPKNTFIESKNTLSVSSAILGFSILPNDHARLIDPQGKVISIY